MERKKQKTLIIFVGSVIFGKSYTFTLQQHTFFGYSRVQKSIKNWSVYSKMALGEVGVSLS